MWCVPAEMFSINRRGKVVTVKDGKVPDVRRAQAARANHNTCKDVDESVPSAFLLVMSTKHQSNAAT